MSNKTQLQNNNTALDGYIARINAAKDTAASLPDAGGGESGSNIQTCTVSITDNNANRFDATEIIYSVLNESGQIETKQAIIWTTSACTFNNVVSGSCIVCTLVDSNGLISDIVINNATVPTNIVRNSLVFTTESTFTGTASVSFGRYE